MKKLLVLLIEPNKLLGQIYLHALESAGYTVYWEKHAQSAVHYLDKKRPDVIVLEPQLVKHGGIEFLYELRSYPDWQQIPVILHTLIPHEAFRASHKTLSGLGVDAYLYKSQTTIVQLLSALRGVTAKTLTL